MDFFAQRYNLFFAQPNTVRREMLCLKSRLKNSRGAQEVKKKYPLFSGATEGGCLLEEGEMLFLPAGWFHEVPPNPEPQGKIVTAQSERQKAAT